MRPRQIGRSYPLQHPSPRETGYDRVTLEKLVSDVVANGQDKLAHHQCQEASAGPQVASSRPDTGAMGSVYSKRRWRDDPSQPRHS